MVRSAAAAQTVPVAGDVDANVERHAALAGRAADAGAGAVVFPELSLTGYELDRAHELAFVERDRRLTPLIELATDRGTTLIVGAPVRLGAGLYIGAFVLGPRGRVDLYTKRHLGAFAATDAPGNAIPPAESTIFRPGTRDPLIEAGGLTAAVAVCADIGHAGHAARAAGRGATAYLASTFVVPTQLADETRRLRTYASRHRMLVVFSNYGGPSGGLPAGGGSAIWSPRGEMLAQLPAAGGGVALAVEEGGRWRGRVLSA